MGKNQNIRIKDIARMAGVSVGTVDRVIHDRGNVSSESERKVKAILKKTNYSPNPIAQSLGAKKEYQISVMLPNPEQDEYWELSNKGVLQAQREWKSYNIDININNFDLERSESFSENIQKLLETKPHAVLTAPIFFDESITFFEKLDEVDIPYILVNTELNPQIKKYNPLCIIGQNHHQSGRVAAELIHISLHEPGQLAVMHIHENVENSIHLKEKEEGFRNYFAEFGNDDFEISTFSFLDEKRSFEEQIGECIAQQDLKGIFVPTSSGTYLTARALGKHHKQQTKLVGYDLLEENIHFLKAGTIDFLINQDPRHQALQGLRYLVNHLLLKIPPPTDDLLPLDIITRQNYTSFLNNHS
ncbi:LacI family DNA-binding transcriptional regulator [Fodinibius salsisoli]|uniref:LacI family DNA-binding transcriptional regulator n=1 Tax=Fodinibius salsisoli TaxID=2820877 RepID=A0ABT3PPY5_9BACT|nr:LacI family DNA-binding transcriptional regulator [Fodinibius salsisoli]MCW9707911.1 LacI family DNA-binding transcriptional regulator [Fodinibius salsisoli]